MLNEETLEFASDLQDYLKSQIDVRKDYWANGSYTEDLTSGNISLGQVWAYQDCLNKIRKMVKRNEEEFQDD